MSKKAANTVSTKTRLLEATEVLFVEHGYEAMSLRQITLLAGTNLAAVNYHFGSKENLVNEVFRRRMDEMTQQNAAMVEQTAAAAESLRAQAARLSGLLTRFKLAA